MALAGCTTAPGHGPWRIEPVYRTTHATPALLNASAGAYAEVAEMFSNEGRHEQAAHWWARATQVPQPAPEHLTRLGASLLQLGRLDEAIAVMARVVELQPRQPSALNNLAYAHARKGEHARSRELLLAALALQPDYERARKNLAWVEAHAPRVAAVISPSDAHTEPAGSAGHAAVAQAPQADVASADRTAAHGIASPQVPANGPTSDLIATPTTAATGSPGPIANELPVVEPRGAAPTDTAGRVTALADAESPGTATAVAPETAASEAKMPQEADSDKMEPLTANVPVMSPSERAAAVANSAADESGTREKVSTPGAASAEPPSAGAPAAVQQVVMVAAKAAEVGAGADAPFAPLLLVSASPLKNPLMQAEPPSPSGSADVQTPAPLETPALAAAAMAANGGAALKASAIEPQGQDRDTTLPPEPTVMALPAQSTEPGAQAESAPAPLAQKVARLDFSASPAQTDAASSAHFPSAQAAALRLAVVNGNGTPGAAAAIGAYLGRQGWQKARLQNLPPFRVLKTVVQYREGFEPAARALLHALPAGTELRLVRAMKRRLDLRVVLGRDPETLALASCQKPGTAKSCAPARAPEGVPSTDSLALR